MTLNPFQKRIRFSLNRIQLTMLLVMRKAAV